MEHNPKIEKISEIIRLLQKLHKIIGVSVSVVLDNNVLWTAGFGNTKIGLDSSLVTPETRFGIGSITKSFTATLLAYVLQSNGSVNWDTPLKNIFGHNFSFGDAFRTEESCLRDILAHKCGIELGEEDFPWLCCSTTRNDMPYKLEDMPQSAAFRKKMIYNNFLYSVAGCVAEKLTGKKWEELIQSLFFDLLEMRDSIFIDHEPNPTSSNIATAHLNVNQSPEPIDIKVHVASGSIGPAASIFTSARDMAKWMKFLLSGCLVDSIPIIDPTFSNECWKPQFALPLGVSGWSGYVSKPDFPVTESRHAYGFGYYLGRYRGYKMVAHTGELFGYDSQITLYPDMKLGIYTSLNSPGGKPAYISNQLIHYYVADLMLGLQPWLDENTICTFPEPWKRREEFFIPQCHAPFDKSLHKANRPLEDYCGTYSHGFMGIVKVSVDDVSGRLRFSCRDGLAQFLLYPDGTEDSFRVEGVDATSFTHRADMFAPHDWMTVKFPSGGDQEKQSTFMQQLVCTLFESCPVFVRLSS